MSEEILAQAAPTTPTEAPASILSTSDQPVISKEESVLDAAGQQEKAEADANNARLLKADPTTLSAEDAAKREELVKSQEEAKAKALEADKAKGVPEKYSIKPPDGVPINPERLAKAEEVFRAKGYTNEQAQAAVDLFISMKKEADKESESNFKTFLEKSAEETMKALNSEGRSAKTELAFVAKARNLAFSPETIEMLSSSGMGNQKSLIMDLAKLGRLFSEEKNVDTGKSALNSKTDAEVLYPNMK